jgi:hypothetical protein
MDEIIRQYLSKLGQKGGASRSKAKIAAVTENLEAAWKAKRKYTRCKRYGSHRFSPTTGRCPCGYHKPSK